MDIHNRAPSTKKGVFSVAEAAHIFGVCRRTIHRRIADGTLRSIRLGGRRLIPVNELDRMLGGSSWRGGAA